MNKTIEIAYTPDEKQKIIQIQNIDYKIKQTDVEYAKLKRKKFKNCKEEKLAIEKMKELEKNVKFYIQKRNSLVKEVYG